MSRVSRVYIVCRVCSLFIVYAVCDGFRVCWVCRVCSVRGVYGMQRVLCVLCVLCVFCVYCVCRVCWVYGMLRNAKVNSAVEVFNCPSYCIFTYYSCSFIDQSLQSWDAIFVFWR